MTGFEAYQICIGIKTHFNSDTYDYFKFNGKTNVSVASYNKRKDRYFYEKLTKQFDTKKELEMFVASFLVYDKFPSWVGNTLSEENLENYNEWKSEMEKFSYQFEETLKDIKEKFSFEDLFKIENEKHPIILKMLIQSFITYEMFIMLDKILGFTKTFDKAMQDDIIWSDLGKKIKKYSQFLNDLPIEKCKKILIKVYGT